MIYGGEDKVLLCGGTDDLQGFLFRLQGRDIHNEAMKCHFKSGYDFQKSKMDKRYKMLRLKMKQDGSLAESSGQLEILVNVDTWANNPQTQRLTLEDPANENLMDTSQVRDAIIKRAHIHEQFGRGSSIQVELKHEVLSGDFEFSEYDIEYYSRTKKEDRNV